MKNNTVQIFVHYSWVFVLREPGGLKLMPQKIEGCSPYILVSAGDSRCSTCSSPPKTPSIILRTAHMEIHIIPVIKSRITYLWRTPIFFRTTKWPRTKILKSYFNIFHQTYICHFYSVHIANKRLRNVQNRLVCIKMIWTTKLYY